jgi:hypothetical protein
MPEEKDKSKTTVEDKDKTTETTEDEFSELFDDKETETETETEIETEEEEKPKKKVIEKKEKTPDVVAVVAEQVQSAEKRLERRGDLTEFFASEKGKMFGKYKEQIQKAALSTRFANIPVSKLPQIILKDEVYERVIQEARKAADTEADDSITGGTTMKSVTPEELKKIDPSTMSKEEFAKLKDRAMRGEFKIKEK